MTCNRCETDCGPTTATQAWVAFALAIALVVMSWTGAAKAGAGHAHHHGDIQTAEVKKKAPEVTIGAVPVAGNITMLIGVGGFTGGNVAVLPGPDGLLIVDDKLTGFGEKLEKALETFGKGRPKFVLNTHWHFDHVGGNERFGDATIIAHDNVRTAMSQPQEFVSLKRKIPASPAVALPDVTYDRTLTLHFNGEEIQVIHLPGGHTDGDSIVYFKNANVLHLGDLFFKGMLPFADVEHGGNAFEMTRNIAEILGRFPADAKVIPGHGPLATMADLKAYHDMLMATTAHIEAGAKAGKDLKALQEAGLPAEWMKWEWPFIKAETWISIVHASLRK